MKIKAALLDFDGTLVNSLPAVNGYFFSALERKGIQLTKKEKDSLGGISIDDIIVWLRKEKKIHISAFEKKMHEIYFWFFKMNLIRPFPGAIKFLENLRKKNIKVAIVSNSPRKYIKKVIKENKLSRYIDEIIAVDDAGIPKPDPKMLGMAAAHLHIKPQHCIMIDDNHPGIVAAHILGIKSILISEEKKDDTADFIIPKIEQAIHIIK